MEPEHLRVGAECEVCSDDEGLKDAWFAATVLRLSSKKKRNKLLIQYKSLVEEDGLKPLREYVHASYVRPLPPIAIARLFKVGEDVDAFHNDGWWKGVVTEVFDDFRYGVFFHNTEELIEFGQADLRVHQEWIDGNWVVPEKQDISITSHNLGGFNDQEHWWKVGNACQSVEMSIQLMSPSATKECTKGKPPLDVINSKKKTAQSTPNQEQSPYYNMNSSQKNMMLSTPKTDAELSQPCKKKKGEKTESPLSLKACNVTTISSSTSTEAKANSIPILIMKGKGTNHLKNPLIDDQPSAKTGILHQETQTESPTFAGIPLNHSLEWYSDDNSMPSNFGQKKQIENDITDPLAKEVPSHGIEYDRSVSHLSFEGSSPCPLTHSHRVNLNPDNVEVEKCKEVEAGEIQLHWQRKKLPQQSQKKRCSLYSIEKVEEARKETLVVQKGRENPSKTQVTGTKASIEGKEPIAYGLGDEVVQREIALKETEMLVTEGSEFLGMGESQVKNTGLFPNEEHLDLIRAEKELLNDPMRRKKIVNDVMKAPLAKKEVSKVPRKRGRPKAMASDVKTPTIQGPECQASCRKIAQGVVETEHKSKEVEMVFSGVSSDSLDEDQTFWIADLFVPPNMGSMDNQPTTQPNLAITWTVNQSNEARGEEQNETISESSGTAPTCADVLVENQSLPFMKGSPAWEMIESMEVFHLMPQRPHFGTLYQYNEEQREGLAVGNMVTFASMVEKARESRLSDPRSVFENRLKALLDLESLGFKVHPIRDRLEELLTIKDRIGQLEDDSKAFEVQIIERKNEKSRIDEEIGQIDEKIRELEYSLTILNKKRTSVMKQREINNSDIDILEMEADAIETKVLNLKLDFDSIAGAPW